MAYTHGHEDGTHSAPARLYGVIDQKIDSAWCGHYSSLLFGAAASDGIGRKIPAARSAKYQKRQRRRVDSECLPGYCQWGSPPLRARLSDMDYDGRFACPSRKEGVEKRVDSYLRLTAGSQWFQRKLVHKLKLVYGFIAADQLLTAFLAPALAKQWKLSLMQQQLLCSCWFAGGLLGYLATGTIADIYGRQLSIRVFATMHAVCSMMLLCSPCFPCMVFLRIMAAFGAAGAFVLCLQLLAENCCQESREERKTETRCAWSIASVVLVIVSCLLRSYPVQMLIIGIVPAAMALLYGAFGVPESPQWLFAAGRKTDAAEAIELIAQENGVHDVDVEDIEDEDMRDIELGFAPCRSRSSSEDTPAEAMESLFDGAQATRTKLMLITSLLSSCAYFGLCFAPISGLNTNMYVAHILAAPIESHLQIWTMCLSPAIGRLRMSCMLYPLFVIALLVVSLPTEVAGACSTSIAFIVARVLGSSICTLKWALALQNFPVESRAVGLAIVASASQVGAMIGPVLHAACPAPFILLATLAGIGGVCMCQVPDTKVY